MTVDRITERELDAALAAAAASIPPLDGFESRVGDGLRRCAETTAPSLEWAVRSTLERVDRSSSASGPRRSRVAWFVVAAAAAAVFFAVLLLGELDDRGAVLASVDNGEIRRRGAADWIAVRGPLRLRGGDEVRAGDESTILRLGSMEACLFPATHVRVAAGARPRVELVTGAIDCASSSADTDVVVDAADSWIVLGRSRAQVRRGPRDGVVYAVFDGEASVRSAVRTERLPAGTAVWIRPGGGAWPVYAVDDRPVRALIARTRERWRHYRDREARRRREDGRPENRAAADVSWTEPSGSTRVLVAWPSPSVRDRARQILATHTVDDRRFVERSVVEAVRIGVPEIGALSARALRAMGESVESIAAIAEAARTHDRRGDATAAAVRAALGEAAPAARFRAIATDVSTALADRVVALAALAGLDDPCDAATAAAAARYGAPHLYAVDWRTSTDFCEIVGFVFGATTAGEAAARGLVLDRALPIESRRRYLGAIVAPSRARWTSLLLEVFYRGEDALRRATLLALLDESAGAPDPGLAAFCELLVNANSAFTELALVGWWRFGSDSDRTRVVDRVDELIAESPDPDLRAAAVRAPLALSAAHDAGRFAPILHRALCDESPLVRRWAALALVRVGRASSVRPVLAAFVRETDASVAVALARALGRLPNAATDPGVGAALAAALASMPAARSSIIAALGDLGTDFARLILEDLRATVSRPDERFAAEAALESIRSRR